MFEPTIIKNRDVLDPDSDFLPNVLLHRDEKIKEIAYYLNYALRGSTPPNILTSGPTGCGKTVVTMRIIHELKKSKKCPIIARTVASGGPFRTLILLARECNCRLPERGISLEEAWGKFSASLKDKLVVLVLDEIDKMLRRGGTDLLYYLSRRPHTCVIGISNFLQVLDLIDDKRVLASYNPRMVRFSSYNASQLTDILKQRAKLGLYKNKYEYSALSYSASVAMRKRAGDARYALDLLLHAAEIAERGGSSVLNQSHVRIAEREVEIEYLRGSVLELPAEKRLLLYIVLDMGECAPSDVYKKVDFYAERLDYPRMDRISERRMGDYLRDLDLEGFVSIERRGRKGMSGKGVRWVVYIYPGLDKKILKEALLESFAVRAPEG